MADPESIDQRLDALLDELPEDAVTVDLDPDADYRVELLGKEADHG